MTRKTKIIAAGAIAGLLGTVAVVGAVQAHGPGGYGPGEGYRMMDQRGDRDDDRGGWGDHHDGPRHSWGGHHGGPGGFHGGPGMGGPGRGEMMRHMFELADADKDGKVTQAEIDQARDARFAKYDADKNGTLSLDEFQNLFVEITHPMIVRAFQHMDPDGDASISKDELGTRSKNLVERFDRNDDGALSIEDRGYGWHGKTKDDDDK